MNDDLIDLESYFAAGKHVSLTTRHDDSISGTIMAFDLQTSMMVVQSDIHKIVCVNLKNIKYVNVDDVEASNYELEFKGLSVPKLRERLEDAVENKKSLAQDTANNSPVGQKL